MQGTPTIKWASPEAEQRYRALLAAKEAMLLVALLPYVGKPVTPDLVEEMAEVARTATTDIDQQLTTLISLYASPAWITSLTGDDDDDGR